MSKRLRPCCVPGCNNKSAPRFIIPTDKRVREIWIERIRNEKLVGSDDLKFLRNHPVCKTHFADICIEDSGRLRKYSLPTLHLPDYNEPSTEENCFCRPETEYRYTTPEKVKEFFKTLPTVYPTAVPSTSKQDVSPLLQVQIPEKVYRQSKKQIFTPLSHLDHPPAPSSTTIVPDVAEIEKIYDVGLGTPSALGIGILPKSPSPYKLDLPLGVTLLPRTPSPPRLVAKSGKKRTRSPGDKMDTNNRLLSDMNQRLDDLSNRVGRISRPEISHGSTAMVDLLLPLKTIKALEHFEEKLKRVFGVQFVVGVARRVELIEENAKKLAGKKGKLHAVKADISKEEDILKAFEWVTKNLGPLSILINNAGVSKEGNLSDAPTEVFKTVLDVNVLGLCIATREAVKIMKANNIDGHIIHICSVAGHVVPNFPGINVYTASKHAVKALAETLRQELVRQQSKIKISEISPGVVTSEMTTLSKEHSPERKSLLSSLPILEPEDIADGVIYALSTPERVQIHEIIIKPVGEPF